MANHITAKEYAFWDLMSGEFIFNIPDYQRPYSWTENEVSALWEDLIKFWNRGYGSNSQTYFLGSVVLVKALHSPEVEVIDGQQRLTTLSILLSLLKSGQGSYSNDIKKCLWEEGIQHKHIEGRPRINLRKRDAVFYQKYIAEESHTPVFDVSQRQVDDDSQRLIINNAKLLNDYVAKSRDFPTFGDIIYLSSKGITSGTSNSSIRYLPSNDSSIPASGSSSDLPINNSA